MTSAARPDAYRAEVTLSFSDEPLALVVADALRVESRDPVPRASAVVTRDGVTVRFDFTARDATSLRAVVNSYLRWAAVAEDAARAAHGASGDARP